MSSLFAQFLRWECTPYVRGLLREALRRRIPKTFEFNRFDISIDHESQTVLLEDVLDATDAGKERIPLAELAAEVEKDPE